MKNYYIAIYALYTDIVTNTTENLVADMYYNDSFDEACAEAEAEIEWMMKVDPAKHIRGYRYEVTGSEETYAKTIEA